MAIALIFPGQGSQKVGMGKALAEAFKAARDVFEAVDEALGQKLSQLIFEGPEAELTLTANVQPALMAVSIAVLRALESERGLDVARHVRFVAGHSLGEYSALTAAGSLDLADAARLLRLRGEAMQAAVPVGHGAMAAILGLDFDKVGDIARRAASETAKVCQAANDNGGEQAVISGSKEAVARAVEIAKEAGAKRAIPLPVSAPFHCELMAPAAKAMAAALAATKIRPPCVPIVANVLARAIDDPEQIRESLVAQVTGPVRWAESMGFMTREGVDVFYELGSGKVLAGLARRIAPSATGIAIGTPEDLPAFNLVSENMDSRNV